VIAIADLVELCAEQYASDLGWFVVLGEHVRHTRDPELQRLLATAAHRHAWHADLWAQRRPAIPHDAVHELPAPAPVVVAGDLVTAYRAHLSSQRTLMARLRAQTDRDLDPSTRRVVDLVDADLVELATRLPA
jgi:hypothetical protein